MPIPPGFDYGAAGWNATGASWFLAEFAGALTGNRAYTLQDADMTLAALNLAQTFTEQQEIRNTLRMGYDVSNYVDITATSTGGLVVRTGGFNIIRDGAGINLQLASYSAASTNAIVSLKARGTESIPTAVQSGDILFSFGGEGFAQTAFAGINNAVEQFVAGENFSSSNKGAYIRWGVTALTTTARRVRLILTEDGMLGVGKVTNGDFGKATVSSRLTVVEEDGETAATTQVARMSHNSTGTAAAYFGGRLGLYLESSTTADQIAAAIDWVWRTATHASRSAYAVLQLTLNAVITAKMAYVGDVALSNNSATGLLDQTLASNTGAGGHMIWSAIGTNGTDFVTLSGTVDWSAVSKTTTITSTITGSTPVEAKSSASTNSATWSITNGSGKITVNLNLNSNMSGTTTWKVHYTAHNGSGQAITVL